MQILKGTTFLFTANITFTFFFLYHECFITFRCYPSKCGVTNIKSEWKILILCGKAKFKWQILN